MGQGGLRHWPELQAAQATSLVTLLHTSLLNTTCTVSSAAISAVHAHAALHAPDAGRGLWRWEPGTHGAPPLKPPFVQGSAAGEIEVGRQGFCHRSTGSTSGRTQLTACTMAARAAVGSGSGGGGGGGTCRSVPAWSGLDAASLLPRSTRSSFHSSLNQGLAPGMVLASVRVRLRVPLRPQTAAESLQCRDRSRSSARVSGSLLGQR